MICQERVDTYMEGIMKMNPLDVGFLDSPPTSGEEGPVFTLHNNHSDKMSTFELARSALISWPWRPSPMTTRRMTWLVRLMEITPLGQPNPAVGRFLFNIIQLDGHMLKHL